ncbi:hypothetical protein NXS19_000529 [Fusarium pseudograminearum]|nr:hypothetical protein NXS19_000529 [Fusarium pseudograminearum]
MPLIGPVITQFVHRKSQIAYRSQKEYHLVLYFTVPTGLKRARRTLFFPVLQKYPGPSDFIEKIRDPRAGWRSIATLNTTRSRAVLELAHTDLNNQVRSLENLTSASLEQRRAKDLPSRHRLPRIGEITATARIPNYRQLQSPDVHCTAYPLLSLAQALTAVTFYVTRSIRICIRIRTRRSTTL